MKYTAEIKPDNRVGDAIETVIERRQLDGRWPLDLLHRERIPLEMETDVGGASRWNTACPPSPALVQHLEFVGRLNHFRKVAGELQEFLGTLSKLCRKN